jgi:O-acetyl-ADP-ribose deacetylase (regulator of RNase III)
MHVDAVVNAANEQLARGGGVCGAIFAAAGVHDLEQACSSIGYCNTGNAVATPAFALDARHVIHAVGPIWRGGGHGEEEALRSCYRTSLTLALELGDRSIAFPLISSGIYGYPKGQALDVAVDEIRSFLDDHEMDVYLALFDAEAIRVSRGRFARVAEYIDDTYVEDNYYARRTMEEPRPPSMAGVPRQRVGASRPQPAAPFAASVQAAPAQAPIADDRMAEPSLDDMLRRLDAPFATTLLAMIDERHLADSTVYKRANLSRQHFSKIRSNPGYRPKKPTVLALAVALELTLDETRLLLERAGYALTHADKRDVIVEYYISHGIYDVVEINLALYSFDQPLLR